MLEGVSRVPVRALVAVCALVTLGVPVGWSTPAGAAGTKTVVVANGGNDSITVFDLTDPENPATTFTVADPAFAGGFPRYVAITKDNMFAAVGLARSTPGVLVWVNLTTSPPSVVGTTDVGRNPQAIVMTETKAVVAVRGDDDRVVLVDLASLYLDPPTAPAVPAARIILPLGSNVEAEGVAVTPDDRAAVITLRGIPGDATRPGQVRYLDLTTNSLRPESTTIGADTEPFAVAITPDGQRALVTNTNATGGGTVSVLDVTGLPGAPGAVIDTIPIGPKPRGIAVTPDGARAAIALEGSHRVAILNLSDLTVTLRPVGSGQFNPFGVAITSLPTTDPVPGGAFVAAVANEGNVDGALEKVTLLDLTPGPSFNVNLAEGSPIVITTTLPHGLVTGQMVSVTGVQGNTAANGVFTVTAENATQCRLNGTTSNGAYTTGGILVPIPPPLDLVEVGQQARGIAISSGRLPRTILSLAPTTGKVGTLIQFDGSKSSDLDGTIEKYTFDFGDGTAAVTKVCATDPDCATTSHAYAKIGTYRPSLIATDNDGNSKKALATVGIKANKLPRAAFTAAPLSGAAPLSVAFTNQSSDGDGTIAVSCWNFGDGGPGCHSADASPTHVFTALGSYTVELVVTDDSGGQSPPVRRIVRVNPNRAPRALFGASPASGKSPLVVKFTNQSTDSDGKVVASCWNFGDGPTGCHSTEVSPTHTYTTPGTYKAQLVVTDNSGAASAVFTRTITVRAP
jgi:PKD repeat protein